MRRPPVACRRAAQSLQWPAAHHICISDDVLALALHPFFPSPCPHQRRHGSHIPGPLEATRRAAKRRMTVSAGFHPPSTLQSLFNLPALFGFRRDPQPAWRYEPPSLQHTAQPLQHANDTLPTLSALQCDQTQHEHAASTPMQSPSAFVTSTSWTQEQENELQVQRGKKAEAAGLEQGSAVTRGRDSKTISVSVRAHLQKFKCKVGYAKAMSPANRKRFIADAWRSCYPDSPDGWVYNTLVVEHLCGLDWDPSAVLSEPESLSLPPLYTPQIQTFLDCLEKSSARFLHAAGIYHGVYMKIAKSAKSADASTNPSQDAELLRIIRLALQGAISPDNRVEPHVAQSLTALANKIHDSDIRKWVCSIWNGTARIQKIATLLLARAALDGKLCATIEQVLSCLPQKNLKLLIPPITASLATAFVRRTSLPHEVYGARLSAWLAVLERLDDRAGPHEAATKYLDTAVAAVAKGVFKSKDPNRAWGYLVLHPLIFQLTRQPAYAAHRERMLQLVYDSAALAHTQQEPLGFETILALTFSHMKREALPYTPLIDMTVNVFAQLVDMYSVYRVLLALKQHELALDNVSVVHARVAKKVALLPQKPESMSQPARQRYAFHLRIAQGIVDLLDKLSSSPPAVANALSNTKQQIVSLQARREFAETLDRARENHALPQMYADTSVDISDSERTVLIHQLAHFYSLSTARTHRETWRSVYYLYHYLRYHSLSIGPLFTKAVVRTAIIRPMMERRFVSARRLIWVCELVARVEGDDVAKQIESNYWRWRGQLIRHAKRAQDEAKGDARDKALVSRIKGLGLI